MSNIPGIYVYPRDIPDQFEWFAFVVDGDVVWSEPVPIQDEAKIAALLTGIQAVRLTGNDRVLVISGYTYENGEWIPPQDLIQQ